MPERVEFHGMTQPAPLHSLVLRWISSGVSLSSDWSLKGCSLAVPWQFCGFLRGYLGLPAAIPCEAIRLTAVARVAPSAAMSFFNCSSNIDFSFCFQHDVINPADTVGTPPHVPVNPVDPEGVITVVPA